MAWKNSYCMSQTENPTLIAFAAAGVAAASWPRRGGSPGASDAGAGVAALEHAATMSAVLTAATQGA